MTQVAGKAENLADDAVGDPSIEPLLRPSSVAIIGAAEDHNRVGGRPLHYLQRFGFRGAIYPVNHSRDMVQGLKAYPTIGDLPEAPDVAVIAIGADRVAEAVDQCAKAGVRGAVIMSSGFSETGPDGMRRQAELVAAAKRGGVRLVGPNAQGVANFGTGAVLNFSTMFMEVAPQDGPVAIISQSGAASVIPYAHLREAGIGVRYVIATGNDAQTSVCEMALTAAADPAIRVVLVYVESLTDPHMLAKAAHVARTRGAMLIALKAGRSAAGARAAASHTGAIVTDDALIDAFLEQHGIWRADDVHGLVNAVELYLSTGGRPGPRLIAISNSGAFGVICADTADRIGMTLAELDAQTCKALSEIMPSFGIAQNPVDLTGAVLSDPTLFGRTLEALSHDPSGDMFLIGVPVAGEGYDLPGMAADTARLIQRKGKPVAVAAPQASVRDFFRAAGIATFRHESDALSALNQFGRHAAIADAAASRPVPAVLRRQGHPIGDRRTATLNEAASLALLEKAGLPVISHRLCRSSAEAVEAWRDIGETVVVKACSAALPHKSEYGLVFLNRTSATAVEEAYETCVKRVHDLGVPSDGVLVAKQVRGVREFALGVKQDPMFGTAVMISDGGKYVEALRDFVVLLHPFGEQDVIDRLRRLRIAPLFDGLRGDPPVDLGFLARAAVALGAYAARSADHVVSIDVNPIIVGAAGTGGWAVDGVIECGVADNG
ncbi:MAG: acetate--CoA ligase family protein [Rhizobiaceae bacterium]|nr:acetate--CoA ligase family protein [Rhizobiaceae bacterium]